MSIVIPAHPSDEWRTPPELFLKLNSEFDFDLDAAATPENALCQFYLTKEDDALAPEWRKVGWPGERVWLNPPYGKQLKFWVEMARWQADMLGKLVVLLLPCHTAEKWFHEWIYDERNRPPHLPWGPCVSEVRFVRGRLKFTLPGEKCTSARFPSMIGVMDGRAQ